MELYFFIQLIILFFLWMLKDKIYHCWCLYSLSNLRKKKQDWESILSQLILENRISQNLIFPQYKFYDSLCLQLVGFSRKYGTHIREHCIFIRKQITLDFQFFEKVLGSFWRVQAEFAVMCSLTWGFHIAINHYLEFDKTISTSLSQSSTTIIMISLEGLGFLLFMFFFYLFAIKSLRIFDQYLKSLIFLKSLLGAHLPFQDICHLSGVNQLLESSQRLDGVHQGVTKLVSQILSRGHTGAVQKLDMLIEELYYRQQVTFDSVQRKITIIKMSCILFLFFPAYLLNIWKIIGNMSF